MYNTQDILDELDLIALEWLDFSETTEENGADVYKSCASMIQEFIKDCEKD